MELVAVNWNEKRLSIPKHCCHKLAIWLIFALSSKLVNLIGRIFIAVDDLYLYRAGTVPGNHTEALFKTFHHDKLQTDRVFPAAVRAGG